MGNVPTVNESVTEDSDDASPDKYCAIDSEKLTRHQAQKVCSHLRGDSKVRCNGSTARLRKTANRLCNNLTDSSTPWPAEKALNAFLPEFP